MRGPEVEPELAALAAAHGVATSYVGTDDRTVTVARDTVVKVLAALDVAAGTPTAVRAALEKARDAPWLRLLPPTVVARAGRSAALVARAPAAGVPALRVELEAGGTVELALTAEPSQSRTVEGERYVSWSGATSPDLPPGWHRLVATVGDRTETTTLIVSPDRLTLPPGLEGQVWGWAVQLYALRSAGSWGTGDLADLAELGRWSGGEQGAAVLLCNPLHAVTPGLPVEASPYFPSSRRFWNPLYLRVEAMAEYGLADAATRSAVDALRVPPDGDRIDRDGVWRAKSAAWELRWAVAARDAEGLAAYRRERGTGLQDFARFCALAERHGLPWRQWPAGIRLPDGPGIEQAAAELAPRVAFHAWLQQRCEDQLSAAQATALAAGMPVGILHDLPVGTDPGGADAWALQGVLAENVTIGAPPDTNIPQGQDWGLPPWRPDRLATLGYAPFRELLQPVLRYAGGLRVDHVPGLFRQWWVPAGGSPASGTYVSYDDEALLGVLALESARAGTLVIGEDLGTVEPRVRSALADRGMLGSDVLWFQQDADGDPLPPQRWRELAAASVSTHDLPTAAGFLLDGPPGQRDALIAALRSWGLLATGAQEGAEVVVGMHRLLSLTPCRVVLAALADAIGDPRQPNRPGTTTEYPNWRLPLADPACRPVSFEGLRRDPGVRRLTEALRGGWAPASVRSSGDDPAPRSRRS